MKPYSSVLFTAKWLKLMNKVNRGMKPENPTGRNFKELLEIDIPTLNSFTRKACFDKAGLFDENLP